MLVDCLTCGKEISPDANRCPHCGAGKMQCVGLTAGGKGFALSIVVFIEITLLIGMLYLADKGESSIMMNLLLVVGAVPLVSIFKAKVREPKKQNE